MKKILCLLICLMLVLTAAPALAAAPEDFNDLPESGYWSYNALVAAIENGLLTGRTENTLAPDGLLSRAEMATIINRAFGAYAEADISGYTDIDADAWYAEEIAKAVQMHTFQGADGKMRPEEYITREEAFTVVARSLLLLEDKDSGAELAYRFSDAGQVSAWAAPYLCALTDAGYIEGSGGKISPKSYITRAEFAQFMYKAVAAYITAAGTYATLPEGNILVRTAGVTFDNVTVSGDLIIGDGVGEGEFSLDDSTVSGRLVVRGGGTQSIDLLGATVIDGSVYIGKTFGSVAVDNQSASSVEGLYFCPGGNTVYIYGNFDNLYLDADNITVIIAAGAVVNNAVISGNNSQLLVNDGGSVSYCVIEEGSADSQLVIEQPDGSQLIFDGSDEEDVVYNGEDGDSGIGGGGGGLNTLNWSDISGLTFIVTYRDELGDLQTIESEAENTAIGGTVSRYTPWNSSIDLSDLDADCEIVSGEIVATLAGGGTLSFDPGYDINPNIPGYDSFQTGQTYTLGEFILGTYYTTSPDTMDVATMRVLLDNFYIYTRDRWESGSGVDWPVEISVDDGTGIPIPYKAVVSGELDSSEYDNTLPYNLTLIWK